MDQDDANVPMGASMVSALLADDVLFEVINPLLAQGFDVWIYRGTEWCIRSVQAPHVDRETATVQFPPGFANGVERFVLTRAALLQNKSRRAGERTNEYESHTTAP